MRISDWGSDVCSSDLAALRQRREQRGVGGEAGREEERGLAAIMARGVGFERLMLGVIAAQQTRAARARGKAAFDARGERVAEGVTIGEAEIVVRREIAAGARREGATAALGGERVDRKGVG